MTNKLFYGHNLDVLRDEIASESVDLIPFVDPSSSKRAKREDEDAPKQRSFL